MSDPLQTDAMRPDPRRAPKDSLVVAVGDLQALVRSLWDRLRIAEAAPLEGKK